MWILCFIHRGAPGAIARGLACLPLVQGRERLHVVGLTGSIASSRDADGFGDAPASYDGPAAALAAALRAWCPAEAAIPPDQVVEATCSSSYQGVGHHLRGNLPDAGRQA